MIRLPIQISFTLWRHQIQASLFSTSTICGEKSTMNRQGKILSKLFGNRVSGSKKRWFENPMPTSRQPRIDSPLRFTNSNKNDHSSNRRTKVLNKLFMTHITDLLATGEASQTILGKGLQITRVKVTPNFQFCNVYWTAKGDSSEPELEEELQKCGGILRHELSQLRLMGEVPRIHFVKDKSFLNIADVETVLKTADLGEDYKKADPSFQLKSDLYSNPAEVFRKKISNNTNDEGPIESFEESDDEEPLPEMRYDVFGLDHRGIMVKILAKMKKSEQAWEQYERGEPLSVVTTEESTTEKLLKLKEKIKESEKNEEYNKFLEKMAENKNNKRKKFRRNNEKNYYRVGDDHDDPLDDGDFIYEDYEEKNK